LQTDPLRGVSPWVGFDCLATSRRKLFPSSSSVVGSYAWEPPLGSGLRSPVSRQASRSASRYRTGPRRPPYFRNGGPMPRLRQLARVFGETPNILAASELPTADSVFDNGGLVPLSCGSIAHDSGCPVRSCVFGRISSRLRCATHYRLATVAACMEHSVKGLSRGPTTYLGRIWP
jgi:hypothetical protein